MSRPIFAPLTAAVLLSGALWAAPGWAAPTYHPPAESLSILRPGPGAELVGARCAVCHSLDYIATQPPRTVSPAFWQAELTKMTKTFGADVPEAERAAILDYLNSRYGQGAAPRP